VRVFEGVPFAAPPVGALRWQAPQPAAPWTGVRKADQFGARCYQGNIFGDMIFRDKGISEDCLYLNVWTPSPAKKHLPVLVYFHGGGFAAGSGDEPRYDGTNFAKKGIIVVTVNYRLGVFGFLAHPELTAESPHKASGNYGMLDQVAALQWVHRNIAAFGGDPGKVTIGGESAGQRGGERADGFSAGRGIVSRRDRRKRRHVQYRRHSGWATVGQGGEDGSRLRHCLRRQVAQRYARRIRRRRSEAPLERRQCVLVRSSTAIS
jgi:hypothetical protein